MNSSDEESAVRLPLILHVDPIWPPHMRKKRQPKSFQGLLKRKKGLLMFLGKNPLPEASSKDFKNEESLLTVMERVRRKEEHQRKSLKKIQNQALARENEALENFKMDTAKELFDSHTTFGEGENLPIRGNCNNLGNDLLQRIKAIRNKINSRQDRSLAARKLKEKMEDNDEIESQAPHGRNIQTEYRKVHGKKDKQRSFSNETDTAGPHDGNKQNKQKTKKLNIKRRIDDQEEKIKPKSKKKETRNAQKNEEKLPQMNIEENMDNQQTKKLTKPRKNTEISRVAAEVSEARIQLEELSTKAGNIDENFENSEEKELPPDDEGRYFQLPQLDGIQRMHRKRPRPVMDPRFTKLLNTLISIQDNTLTYSMD